MKKALPESRSNPLLAAAIVLPAILRIAALFLPVDRLWGFDVLRDFPLWEQAAYSVLPMTVLLLLTRKGARFVDDLTERKGHVIAALGLLLLLSATLLWPMETFFYGDGGALIPQIHRFSVDGHYDAALLMNLKSSPLTGVLLTAAMHAIPAATSMFGLEYPSTALYPFRAVSAVALIGASLYILIALPRRERPAAMLLLGGTAGSLLMFGYAEFYAPVFAAITVFLLAADRALRGEASTGIAVLAWVLAVTTHYLSLSLLPAVLYLLAVHFAATPAARLAGHPFRAAAILIAVFAALYWLTGLAVSDNRVIMPAKEIATGAGTLRYTLFSIWHLADIVNLFFLLAPSAVFLIGGSFLRRRSDASNVAGMRFAMLATLFLAVFVLFANTSLGLARDWDLTAPLGVCLLFTAMAMLSACTSAAHRSISDLTSDNDRHLAAASLRPERSAAGTPHDIERSLSGAKSKGQHPESASAASPYSHHDIISRRGGHSAVLALGLASLLFTVPWIVSGTRSDAAAERFERIMRLDDEHMYGDYAISGYEALRKYYRNQGADDRDIGLTRRMIEILDYPQHYRELLDAAARIHAGDANRYDEIQQWMLERLHRKARELQASGKQRDYSIGLDQIDSLAQGIGIQSLSLRVPFPEAALHRIAAATRGGRLWPGIEGMRAYAGGDYPGAVREFEAALGTGFAAPQVYLFSGNALALTGRHTAALERLEQGVSLFPNDAMLRYTLGKYYMRAGIRRDRAVELLLWCLERGVPEERQQEIGELLRASSGR